MIKENEVYVKIGSWNHKHYKDLGYSGVAKGVSVLVKVEDLTSSSHSNWNGYDYYDNEYIKENYNLHYYHPDYPTIDHKISIKYGFDNNIPIEDIADINNLCFTKKRLNTRKYTKNEADFKC